MLRDTVCVGYLFNQIIRNSDFSSIDSKWTVEFSFEMLFDLLPLCFNYQIKTSHLSAKRDYCGRNLLSKENSQTISKIRKLRFMDVSIL